MNDTTSSICLGLVCRFGRVGDDICHDPIQQAKFDGLEDVVVELSKEIVVWMGVEQPDLRDSRKSWSS